MKTPWMFRPTIYITNPGSWTMHGEGRLLHIQAQPPSWLQRAVDGWAPLLAPSRLDLAAVNGWGPGPAITAGEYRKRMEAWLREPRNHALLPALILKGHEGQLVEGLLGDEDTLVCTCSREVAQANGCHRVWVARHLARGDRYRVVLDGDLLGEDGRRFGRPHRRKHKKSARVPPEKRHSA